LADVTWDFDFEPAAADDFVRAYAEGLNHGPFLVPVGALECLSALRRLGAGRALTLMVDKGPSTLEQLAHAPFPGLARHGCVSALVNFHSIKAWAEDGQWLAPRAPDADLGTFALADGASPAQVSGTRAAFDAALGDGPLLAALALVDEVAGRDAPPALELLEALAATNFSPDAAMRLAGALRAVAPGLDPELLPTLVAALDAVWKNHFEFGEEIDLAFELATVLHRAGQLSHAARFYEASVAGRGAHATTCFNLALCHLDLGKREQARACLERVVALAPEHDRAKALLAALGP
jgi:tetratricopeptide (TPR) repeat protein